MEKSQLKATIEKLVPEAKFEEDFEFVRFLIPADKFHSAAKQIKENQDLAFDYLYCLTGMDWGNSYGVVYHLESTKHRHSLVLKTNAVSKEKPVVDSVSDIWATADFHEREVFDFFGVEFNNHPDMRRIFMPEDWNGFPFRKNYVDEVNIIER